MNLDESEQSIFSPNAYADNDNVGNKEKTKDSTEGVNALRSIPQKDVMKMVKELKVNQEECDPNDPGMLKLYNEFDKILPKSNISAIN